MVHPLLPRPAHRPHAANANPVVLLTECLLPKLAIEGERSERAPAGGAQGARGAERASTYTQACLPDASVTAIRT
jgi:hypothetical protein